MVHLSFAGQQFIVLPQGALFWPARRALIVADLHFEKASWFARFGQLLPPYDSAATLHDLTALAAATDARALWCLGDSFHDTEGVDRLSGEAKALLDRLCASLACHWVVGNHDAGLGHFCGGDVIEETELDGIRLRHAADPADPRPELSGHYHPKLRVTIRGRHVARRCFIAGASKLILPAFGALTGGLDARHREIRRVAGPGAEALVPLSDRLLRFPLAAGSSQIIFPNI